MKQLILMRHGIADDNFQGSDLSRPLTKEGESLQLQVAQFIHQYATNIDAILYSPFLRAEQSAEIVKKEYPKAKMLKEPALGSVFDSYTILRHIGEKNIECALVIGHAPTITAFGKSLMQHPKPLRFDKSGAVILNFDREISFGKGEIFQIISPKDLK